MKEKKKEKEEKETMTAQSEVEFNTDNNGNNEEQNSIDSQDEGQHVDSNDNNEIDHDDSQSSEQTDQFDTVELLSSIAELEEKIVSLQAEKESLNNRLARLQADFTNYRKRTDKEMGRVQSTTIVELIRELLPAIDNFERALAQQESNDDFKKGVEMIYRQLITFLNKQGVELIESIGEQFDHNYHNAVMQVESTDHESGEIIEELQKGYILGELVIRPAMVKVAE